MDQEELHPKCLIHTQTWFCLWDHRLLNWCYDWMKPWVFRRWRVYFVYEKDMNHWGQRFHFTKMEPNESHLLVKSTLMRSLPSWDLLCRWDISKCNASRGLISKHLHTGVWILEALLSPCEETQSCLLKYGRYHIVKHQAILEIYAEASPLANLLVGCSSSISESGEGSKRITQVRNQC